MNRDKLELIFNSDKFAIPSKFKSLSNINKQIYNTLISQKAYEIKSNVRESLLLNS